MELNYIYTNNKNYIYICIRFQNVGLHFYFQCVCVMLQMTKRKQGEVYCHKKFENLFLFQLQILEFIMVISEIIAKVVISIRKIFTVAIIRINSRLLELI